MSALAPYDGELFSVDWAITDGHTVVRLTGELDVGSVPCFAEALERAHARGARTIVLELSELRFIDSSGLHALVAALKRQRGVGGDVVLHGATPSTRRVLDITGLSTVFTVES